MNNLQVFIELKFTPVCVYLYFSREKNQFHQMLKPKVHKLNDLTRSFQSIIPWTRVFKVYGYFIGDMRNDFQVVYNKRFPFSRGLFDTENFKHTGAIRKVSMHVI